MRVALSAKRQGEAAEAAFLLRATELGMTVARPWGDSAPYDFIVAGRRLHRVQVKSTAARESQKCSFRIGVGWGHRQKHAYDVACIDFLAVLIVPLRAWYIIPVRALAGRKSIRLASDHPASRRLFDRFREAWSRLA